MCFPDVYEIEMLNTKYTPISVDKIILSLYNLNHKYFTYEKKDRPLYAHQNETDEILYLQENLLKPIEKAGAATFQTDLERFVYQEKDALTEIDKRLAKRKYLLGDTVTEADKLLYQTLLRHDYIYYYLYKQKILFLPLVLIITCRYNAVYKPKYKYSVHQYDKSIGLYH